MVKTIKISLLAFFLILLIAGAGFWQGLYSPAGEDSAKRPFIVARGEGVKQISANLEATGLIRSRWYFNFYVWRIGKQANLIAGDYLLSPSMPVKEIVETLIGGRVADREKEIKIVEGLNIAQIDEYLAGAGTVGAGDFIKLASTPPATWAKSPGAEGAADSDILSGLPDALTLEGFLFPDTYRIFADASAADIIARMLDNFRQKFSPELRAEIERQGRDISEVVILASIIEREVSTPRDRKMVADIFKKRLDTNFPLQADSTVNYITGKKTPAISLSDRDIDSPYNTYQYPGLPPGPICNPGLSSIMAAIYPEPNDYWYFLSRLDTGETIFSRTYDEHLANKAKYLK